MAGAGMITGGMASGDSVAAPLAGSPEDMAKTKFMTELFLDNHLIEVAPGVSRRVHQPKKHLTGPVVRNECWWERNFFEPYTTMYDKEERLFKMWARTGSDNSRHLLDGHAAYMTYLTSRDGVHWDRPKLGVVEVAGRRDHNIIFTSDMVSTTDTTNFQRKRKFVTTPLISQGKKAFFWSVVKHPHPRDANEKYIALAIVQDKQRVVDGAHLVTSPDGIHWSCENEPFWQTPHDVSGKGDDCLMDIFYDQAKQKWVLYRRIIPEFSERMVANESDRERKRADRYYRSYAYVESEDLQEWKNFQFILSMEPDDPADTELYQFSCQKYGEIYVGYLTVFHLDRQSKDIQLATSRDGLKFTRVCRGEPFIPSGALGYYDYMLMTCTQPDPVIVDDIVYIYYAALNIRHDFHPEQEGEDGSVGLATFKRDRFASLETGDKDAGPSRVITKPFIVRHPKLYLNAATWMKGSIRAEALTRDWQPIPGFSEPEAREIQGDALNHPVRWKENANLSKLLGKEIRLKFYMTRARIHAMTLSDEDRKVGPVGNDYQNDKLSDSSPKLI